MELNFTSLLGHKRVKRTCKVRYGRGRALHHVALLTDFSDTGAFIKPTEVYDVGTHINVSVEVEGKKLKASGEVVWSSDVPMSFLSDEKKHGLGVKFTEVDDDFIEFYKESLKLQADDSR